MNFIDQVKISVSSGDGGNGCASFRREKYVPKGGPDGGDGGRGGDVILRGSEDINTLLNFRFKREYKAQRGFDGMKTKKYGKHGESLILDVPIGTLVYDQQSEELIVDITEHGQEFIVAKGGKGGLGNVHFKNSVNQTPRFAGDGYPGEQFNLRLELKLLADVGLVGCPNAGKSTLISVFSAAKPKVGAYPFTTLQPVLGMVENGYGDAFVMADIPGLLEGAHEGVGLGHEFLRHVERTKILLFLIDVSGYNNDLLDDYEILQKELQRYNPEILQKKRLVVLNKVDLTYDEAQVQALKDKVQEPVHLISAVSQEGCKELKDALWAMIHNEAETEQY